MTTRKKILVLPGDGIGAEVLDAALPLFDEVDLDFELTAGEIGWTCWQREGDPIPKSTWEKIYETDSILLGAITSMPEREALEALPPALKTQQKQYVSPIVQLRKKLDLYANVRPIWSLQNGAPFRLTVIRENTEGLYAGLDHFPVDPALQTQLGVYKDLDPHDLSCAMRIQTRAGLSRLYRFAFDYAYQHQLPRVTLADKPNVLRKSGAFAREIFESIATEYERFHITADIQNVDAVALWMVRRPEQFGVIVAENMFGDILSDLGAGLMGGLGFAPSANLGERFSYFEPVHGSAPNMPPYKANPSAMFLSIAMLWEHFGHTQEANRLKNAVSDTLRAGKILSYDAGGQASTKTVAQAILQQFKKPKLQKSIGLLIVGDEITQGHLQDTNSHFVAKALSSAHMEVREIVQVRDHVGDIERATQRLMADCDAVISMGGLGPTTDDLTREGIAKALKKPLLFNADVWQHVTQRLNRFNLTISPGNRRQAYFPEGADLIPNAQGTAYGAHLHTDHHDVFFLPGPPREMQPMFHEAVLPVLKHRGFTRYHHEKTCMLLGVIEGEVSDCLEQCLAIEGDYTMAYLWRYPYVQVTLKTEHLTDLEQFVRVIEQQFRAQLLQWNAFKASELLPQMLEETDATLWVEEALTAGQFETLSPRILGPGKKTPCHATLFVQGTGLAELREGKPWGGQSSVSVKIQADHDGKGLSRESPLMLEETWRMPYRGPDVRVYALEALAFGTLKALARCIDPSSGQPYHEPVNPSQRAN